MRADAPRPPHDFAHRGLGTSGRGEHCRFDPGCFGRRVGAGYDRREWGSSDSSSASRSRSADTLAASLTDIPRLVERLVDDERLPGAVRDAIESWQVEREGTGLRVRFRLPPLDDALIEAVAGSLR